MTTHKMTSLAVIHAHEDTIYIVDEFASRKARRLALLDPLFNSRPNSYLFEMLLSLLNKGSLISTALSVKCFKKVYPCVGECFYLVYKEFSAKRGGRAPPPPFWIHACLRRLYNYMHV